MKIADHIAAINSGNITKTNVIGIRKLLNSHWRESHGYSVSMTAPRATEDEIETLLDAIWNIRPVIMGELHDSGVVLLTSKRYRRNLEYVQNKIDSGILQFRLWGFADVGRGYHIPTYECVTAAGTFRFRNIPWQSGGKGPEVIKA